MQGFQGHHELVLQVTDTAVAELPDDLLRHLRHVTSLTLDLRRNRLINLSPSTLYQNGSDWQAPGTRLVKGQRVSHTTRTPADTLQVSAPGAHPRGLRAPLGT